MSLNGEFLKEQEEKAKRKAEEEASKPPKQKKRRRKPNTAYNASSAGLYRVVLYAAHNDVRVCQSLSWCRDVIACDAAGSELLLISIFIEVS